MPTERIGPSPPIDCEGESVSADRSAETERGGPSGIDADAASPHSYSGRAEGDQSDAVGKGKSRLSNAATLGVAGAVGGGAAGMLVRWGGVGVAAAGGAVGFPVIIPVVVGAAAGLGVVAAARALKGPAARTSSAVRHKVGDAAPEAAEEGASTEAEAASVVDTGAEGAESGASRAAAAAGAAGAAAVVAGASLIPKLRGTIFKNAEPGHIRVPPNARESLYKKQQGICNGCGNKYLRKDLTLDHIVPRVKGGTNKIENLQLLCHHCNAVKGMRSWERFLKSKENPGPGTGPAHPVDQTSDEES